LGVNRSAEEVASVTKLSFVKIDSALLDTTAFGGIKALSGLEMISGVADAVARR
jgi:hypothetical protein